MLHLPDPPRTHSLATLEQSYELCRQVTAKYSKTFYWGSALMPLAKRRAIWAIYVWCRRTDELVDGPMAKLTTPETLDDWERRLEQLFAGQALDNPDVALVDAISRYNLDIQPFRDMIAGQRMDLYRSRYETYEELELYCYRVAGTVGLMTTPVLGVASEPARAPWDGFLQMQTSPDRNPDDPTQRAIALGIANQLTNILRDVGEDRHRGRIYLPLEDLERFRYTEQDLMNGVVDERWRALMQFQIQRARTIFDSAAQGIRLLHPDARWPVWAALMLYSRILNSIERNGYDVFNKRAYVPTTGKVRCLPVALMRSQVL
ncbi:MAG: phytoene synthase [Oscillatoriales cyanobacterium]|nr:MAG: phytoene synthase [Oscillatoriales cyanobacterium]